MRVGVIFIHGVAIGLLVNYWGLRARKFKPRHTPLSEIFVSVKFSTLINRCQQPNLEEEKMPAQSDEGIEPAGLRVFFEDISGITVPSNALREERGRREGRGGYDNTSDGVTFWGVKLSLSGAIWGEVVGVNLLPISGR